MSPLDMLRMAVPGTPGEDYPIFAEVPDTGFDCNGKTKNETFFLFLKKFPVREKFVTATKKIF